jgi:soluble cytochrome b562
MSQNTTTKKKPSRKPTKQNSFASSTCYDFKDGYRAYIIELDNMIDIAQNKKPKRLKEGYKDRAEYREGYYHAIMTLFCMTAWIDYPNDSINKKQIQKTLNNHNRQI